MKEKGMSINEAMSGEAMTISHQQPFAEMENGLFSWALTTCLLWFFETFLVLRRKNRIAHVFIGTSFPLAGMYLASKFLGANYLNSLETNIGIGFVEWGGIICCFLAPLSLVLLVINIRRDPEPGPNKPLILRGEGPIPATIGFVLFAYIIITTFWWVGVM